MKCYYNLKIRIEKKGNRKFRATAKSNVWIFIDPKQPIISIAGWENSKLTIA